MKIRFLSFTLVLSGSSVIAADAVKQTIDVLRQQPLIGQEVGAGLRKALTHTFPFTLIYSPEEKEILIVAVAHQRRKPGYWRERVGR